MYFPQGGGCSPQPCASGEVAEGICKLQVCVQESQADPGAKRGLRLRFIMEFMEVSEN